MDVRNIFMVISLLLSVVIGLLLGRGAHEGQNPRGAGSSPPAIGLALDTLKEARWQHDRDEFVNQCKSLGADVSVNDANSNDTQQAQDVQSLLAHGCHVIALVPHDGLAMAKSVDDAKSQGAMVLSYDRLVRNCAPDVYVSFDNIAVGRQQAQTLLDHMPTPGHGNIVRIYGAPTDNNAKMFKQGQDEALKPYLDRGDVHVVLEDWAEDWKTENAKRIMNAAIVQHLQFDGALVSNDGTALGAIQALQEAGLAGKVLVTGQDADLANCQRIAQGLQLMTVYKPVKQLARVAAETAVSLATGKPIIATSMVNNGKIDVPSVLYDTVAVTKDNMVSTVVKDGFHTYDEIYGNVPPEMRPPRP